MAAMDLRQLRYYLAIVDQGSFTRAAEVLNIAQPALSQHVRRLEEDLGVDLLLRTPRGVVPTESGERLASQARSLLRDVETIRESLRDEAAHPRGRVAFGIPTSVGARLSVPIIEAIQQRLPRVSLRVVEALSGHILEWLQSGRLDLALVFDAQGVPGLVAEKIVTEHLYLVGPPDAAICARPTVRLTDLAGLPLILPGTPHGLREEVDSYARACGAKLTVTVEIDALNHIKTLVMRRAGYTILSKRVVEDELAGGRLAASPIVAPSLERIIYMAYASDRPLSSACRHVKGVIAAILDPLIENGIWRSESRGEGFAEP